MIRRMRIVLSTRMRAIEQWGGKIPCRARGHGIEIRKEINASQQLKEKLKDTNLKWIK